MPTTTVVAHPRPHPEVTSVKMPAATNPSPILPETEPSPILPDPGPAEPAPILPQTPTPGGDPAPVVPAEEPTPIDPQPSPEPIAPSGDARMGSAPR